MGMNRLPSIGGRQQGSGRLSERSAILLRMVTWKDRGTSHVACDFAMKSSDLDACLFVCGAIFA